jgi:DTW domain-containing protein YfiP
MNRRLDKTQQRIRALPEGEYRERCYGCYRPVESCFCDSIPRINNQTEVLILQHQRERSHPFNTARIVNRALDRCQLLFDRNESFSQRELPIIEGAALLYPGKDSRLLDELSPNERPKQLIVIDGTWDQARTLFRDIPQLHDLPQFKLAPSTPGRYRIRREPTDTSLSTLEATVQSLQLLEPHTLGLNGLLDAFNAMIEKQLSHPDANYGDGSPRPKVETLNVPKSFGRNANQIVVAYGEATPVVYMSEEGWTNLNRKKKQAAKLPPVYWVAQRLSEKSSESELFCKTITPIDPISPANLSHMELSESDFESAVSVEAFRQSWDEFLRPGDLLVVPNQKTIRLLQHAGGTVGSCEQLKSINFDPRHEFANVGDFLASVPWPIESAKHRGRAGTRLAKSVALVWYLRTMQARAASS